MATSTKLDQRNAEAVLDVIRTRRVTRSFTGEPVTPDDLHQVLEAGRWASAGGNRRVHRFLVVQDPTTIRLIKLISPGMLGVPTALVMICVDSEAMEQQGASERNPAGGWIDTGTAAMNMLIAAHALGLGACPVTSFSQSGMKVLLELPAAVMPQLMVLLGHPAPHKRVLRAGANTKVTVEDLTFWERYGQRDRP